MQQSHKASIDKLQTEKINPATQDIDRVSTIEIIRMLNEQDRSVAEIVAGKSAEIAGAVDLITQRMKQGGRLFYIGAGTSGRLGILDASECPPTFSVDPGLVIGIIAGGDIAIRQAVENAEDDTGMAQKQLSAYNLTEKDVVCGISASGRTPYVMGGLRYSRNLGAATIGISNNAESEIAAWCDVIIEAVTGPEALSGSTRLKAGTAQKMILNMLSTATMVQQGKTYRNRMVDLCATNEKLQQRSVNLLKGLFPAQDTAMLTKTLSDADGSVKLAAVMVQAGADADHARRLLEQADGFLRTILENPNGDQYVSD